MTNKTHASDCAFHNGPAMMPMPCDCGADPDMTPAEYGREFPMVTPTKEQAQTLINAVEKTVSPLVASDTHAYITKLEERVKVLEDAAKERIHYGVPLTDISFDIQSGSDRQITVCVFESMRKQLKYLAALAGGKDGV